MVRKKMMWPKKYEFASRISSIPWFWLIDRFYQYRSTIFIYSLVKLWIHDKKNYSEMYFWNCPMCCFGLSMFFFIRQFDSLSIFYYYDMIHFDNVNTVIQFHDKIEILINFIIIIMIAYVFHSIIIIMEMDRE